MPCLSEMLSYAIALKKKQKTIEQTDWSQVRGQEHTATTSSTKDYTQTVHATPFIPFIVCHTKYYLLTQK